MKILELGKFYPPVRGGIETLLESMCRGFVTKGAGVRCVVANGDSETVHENRDGISLTRCASYGSVLSTSLCPSYFRETRREDADIWHAHFPNPLADFAVLRSPKSARVVITYHSDIVRQAGVMRVYGRVLQRVLERADRIVVATPRNLEFSPWLQPHHAKVRVIPFGINAGRLTKPSSLPENIARPNGRAILLTVGRLVGYKGHRFLIEAMRNLNATLWIVGSGPMEGELRAQVTALSLAERVEFLGDVSDEALPGLYQACDIFVLPSITPNEAFGLVQLEAMVCGKPVVSCDLKSGVPWVNQHEVTGLIVPPGDSAALGAAIRRLETQPAVARHFGEAGRARVLNEFSEQRMVNDYLQLFEELS
jgi:rhamnosyl/mannosyltransferase